MRQMHKETPFNAFVGDASYSEVSGEEDEAFPSQRFGNDKPHTGRTTDRGNIHQYRSSNEQRGVHDGQQHQNS